MNNDQSTFPSGNGLLRAVPGAAPCLPSLVYNEIVKQCQCFLVLYTWYVVYSKLPLLTTICLVSIRLLVLDYLWIMFKILAFIVILIIFI